MLLIKINLTAETSAEHATPTVLAHGVPLAICFISSFGVNKNCGSKPYNNFVFSYCTVVTKATMDDHVRNAIASWVEQIVKWLLKLLKALVKKIAGELLKRYKYTKPFAKWLKPMADWLIDKIADFLDKSLDTAKNVAKYVKRALENSTKYITDTPSF